ncbi:hypothetical protein FSP39_013002 [Pinctada imbricata]|uniref:SAP domain-containing protein n=1 Tax=Pinctada imbricata TaxID=66713 RepID=A0AA88Y6Y2_PINIB|nr:hypothetical protein FSP39_013002 [Pinctada imbricata]
MEEQAKAAAAAASGESPSGGEAVDEPTSPQSSLEEMSLQQSMDKNKESLKRKLMMRRSVNELVDQGIYPPLKTPPAFAEQRKHLERAKTGDLLRHKIQHRPDRQVLVQQHILEDTKIDPSLHERQRKLKRARIADDLNDKLSHRPGPLELIEGNILETDNENFKTAIQDGSLSFNRTFDNDDATNFGFDDDGTTSDSSPSPWHDGDSSMSDIGSPPISSVPEPPLTFQFKQRTTVPTPSVSSPSIVSMALSKLSPITTQSFSITNTSPVNSHGLHIASKLSQSSNLNKNNRLKKPKPKTQPKTKVIKFHEYKGPPNVVKTQTATGASAAAAAAAALNNPNSETPYHILLQQQQLFLQWQLEFQSKNLNMPVTLVPAEQPSDTSLSQQPPQIPAPITLQPQSSTVTQVVMTSSVTTSPTTVTSTPLLQGQPAITSPTIQTVVPQAVVPQTLLQGKPGIATVIKKPNGQTIIQTTPKPVGQPKPQLTAQPQVQLHTAPPSQLQPPLQGQPQVQKTAIVKSVSTPLLNQQKTQQISRPINQSAKASSQSTILKPLVNLEDMKVADLKVELKKRNLTVSGAKPQLIERLKPYIDVIVAPANSSANANSAVSAVSKLPVHAVVNVKSLGTSSSSSLSSNEITMSSSSPPCSPLNTDRIMKPMSPEVMDTAPSTSVLTAQMKNSLNSSHNSIPMAVDTSRPPSVNPDSEMEIDNTLDLSGGLISLSKGLTSPPATTTTITFVTSPRQAQVQQIQIVQPKVVSISPTAQIAQPKVVYTSPGTQIVQPSLINSSPVTSPQQNVVPSSPEISHEDILQQQRLKIEQLQKQLRRIAETSEASTDATSTPTGATKAT